MAAYRPAISVIVAVRDAMPYLDAALASLAAQDFPDFEVIVVDNGSRDDGPRVAEEWARSDERFHVFFHTRPGLTRALTFAVERTRAPLLGRLDGDDIALPERLSVQHAFMQAHPSVGLAGSWVETMDVAGRGTGERRLPTGDRELRQFLRTGNPFVHSSVVMRREAYERAGGYRLGMPICEDFDLWSRMAEVTELANIDRVLVRYRVHAASLSRRHPTRVAIADTCLIAAQEARRRGTSEPFENGRPVLRRALDITKASRTEFRHRMCYATMKTMVANARLARLNGRRERETRLRRKALRLLFGLRPGDLPGGLAQIVASYFTPHSRQRRRLAVRVGRAARLKEQRVRP